AMDFEEESNLHIYGEHLCIVQLYDKEHYYILDALSLNKTQEGKKALEDFFLSPMEKIMFACQSDASLVRKTMGIQINNILDVRVYAIALEFMGNLTGLIERNLGIQTEDPKLKKKYQTANWLIRPICEEQIAYALSDVQYLFDLKDSLEKEIKEKLSTGKQKAVYFEMKHCALQKNKERPGWEKICNYKLLSKEEKIFIKHFFLARDTLARKANTPAVNILSKQTIVAMTRKRTWKGLIPENKKHLEPVFEKARLDALEELNH
ncbi:MAG: hypothetical protein HUK24_02685, partial [Sphaerochaetaceae bacterium]|nr:hypothetical protein [Sphaerochaetaceae bacterium]